MTCYFSSTAVSESDTCVIFSGLNLSHKLKDKGYIAPIQIEVNSIFGSDCQIPVLWGIKKSWIENDTQNFLI